MADYYHVVRVIETKRRHPRYLYCFDGHRRYRYALEPDDSDGLMVMPQRDAVLSQGLGWQGSQLTHKGRFTVNEVEHQGAPDTLTIRARSADFRGRSIPAGKPLNTTPP